MQLPPEQVKRVADAEGKLKDKETKKALDDVRIGNNKIAQLKRWIADAKHTTLEPVKDNQISRTGMCRCYSSKTAAGWCARCATDPPPFLGPLVI